MMRRLLLGLVTSVALAGFVSMVGRGGSGLLAQARQPRLVVFEIHDSTCSTCRSAASAVDALAVRYDQAAQPVLFVEYNSSEPLGNRIDRWYDARDPRRGCALPLIVVDSGWRWSCGHENFDSVYSGLVDQALANPAGAELTGTYTRSGNALDVWLHVVNRSGKSIGPENGTTANVIVFERTKVLNTQRYGRAVAEAALVASLADGGQATYSMHLASVPVANWERAVVVVLLDYRPDPGSQRYEALQVAIAVEGAPPTATPQPSPTRTATPTATMTATRVPTETATATNAPEITASATTPGTPGWTETPSAPPTPTSTSDASARSLFFPLAIRARAS